MSALNSNAIFRTVKSYLIISIGLFIYAFAWKAFIIPREIGGGAAAGVATIIYYISGKCISPGITIFVLNAILVIIGTRLLGRGFGTKTIYGIFFMSIMFSVLHEPEFITHQFGDSDKLICAIVGGIVSGAGIAITFMQGGSAGGTDIVAMIINKYRNITPGKVFLYSDLVIIGLSYFINNNLRTIVYGYVMMAVFSYTVDLLLSGNRQSVQILVFSKHFEQIAKLIIHEKRRGVTALDATGWYSREAGKVLVILARKNELNDIYRIIKGVDPDALISVASVMGVFGKGFDTIKTSKVKSNA
jgi:uncharacterized membrane-anchored protein YitT (DUF2179 family)